MNFNKISILVVVAGIILLGGIVIIYLMMMKPTSNVVSDDTQTVSQPSSNNTNSETTSTNTTPSTPATVTPTKKVAIQAGGSIVVKDFIEDSATTKDAVNEGHYFIGPHYSQDNEDTTGTEDPPYMIEYIEADQSFTIALLEEPIAATRKTAEEFLMAQLGLTKEGMCLLHYSVSVPNGVNSYYAGKSLKFSFCPGAVPL